MEPKSPAEITTEDYVKDPDKRLAALKAVAKLYTGQ